MTKINVDRTVAQMQKQFAKVKDQKSITIDDLPAGKLRDLAQLAAPRRRVDIGSGCSSFMETSPTIGSKRLATAIENFAKDLRKADKDRDKFVNTAEAKGLSRMSKNLLDLNADGGTFVSTSCFG